MHHYVNDRGRMRMVWGFIHCLLSVHKADGWEERRSFWSLFAVYDMDHKPGESEVGFGGWLLCIMGTTKQRVGGVGWGGRGRISGLIPCLQYAQKAEGRGITRVQSTLLENSLAYIIVIFLEPLQATVDICTYLLWDFNCTRMYLYMYQSLILPNVSCHV